MALDIGVDERLRIQLGLVTRTQALAAGMTRSTIAGRLTSGAWDATLPGVYRAAAAPRTAEQRILAHCLHLDGYASHETAAWLWGLSGFGEPDKVHVSTTRGKESPSEDAVVHTRRDGLGEYTLRRHVPTTLLARTVLDVTPGLSRDRLEVVLDSGWRIRRELFDELDELISTLKPRGREGIATLTELVMIRRGTVATDSDFETQVLQRVRAAGLIAPLLQCSLYDGQKVLMRADFVWPAQKVVLLPDGTSFHKPKKQFEEDAAIRARLTALGWKYISVPRGLRDDSRWLAALTLLVPKAQIPLWPRSPVRRVPTPPRLPRKPPAPSTQLPLPDPAPSV